MEKNSTIEEDLGNQLLNLNLIPLDIKSKINYILKTSPFQNKLFSLKEIRREYVLKMGKTLTELKILIKNNEELKKYEYKSKRANSIAIIWEIYREQERFLPSWRTCKRWIYEYKTSKNIIKNKPSKKFVLPSNINKLVGKQKRKVVSWKKKYNDLKIKNDKNDKLLSQIEKKIKNLIEVNENENLIEREKKLASILFLIQHRK